MENYKLVIPNWNADSSIYDQFDSISNLIIPAQGRLGYPGWCENRCKTRLLECVPRCYDFPTFGPNKICIEKCANTFSSCLSGCSRPFPGLPANS